jgi:hypothetical protein
MSLSEVKNHVSAIESNKFYKGNCTGIDGYQTTMGFFSFNKEQKASFIEACFCSTVMDKFRINAGHASLVYSGNIQHFFKLNIIVCDVLDQHFFQDYKNITFISDNADLVNFVQFGKFELCNPVNISDPITMVLPIELFLILNQSFTSKDIYVSRVIFINSHKIRPFQSDMKIRASFVWIEDKHHTFQGGFLSNVFYNIISVKGLYTCIAADYYEPFYCEEQVTYFTIDTGRIRSISSRDYLQNKVHFLSKERKKVITSIITKEQETECSICLDKILSNQLLGLTSCCQYSVCSQCADSMVLSEHSHQCFACRKPNLYLNFVKPCMSYQFSLKETIPDFDKTKRYLVVSSKYYQKYLYREKNIIVTRYPFKLKEYKFHAIILLSYYSTYFKEELCSKIGDKNLKIYEIKN